MKAILQPSELRLGNFITAQGKLAIVREIGHMDMVVFFPESKKEIKWDRVRYGGEQSSGIPLSEEWLKKFGFSNVESISKGWYKKGIEVSGRVRYMHIITEYGTPVVNNLDYQADIKYVHQLQNLYFALTGEELTINEQG